MAVELKCENIYIIRQCRQLAAEGETAHAYIGGVNGVLICAAAPLPMPFLFIAYEALMCVRHSKTKSICKHNITVTAVCS